MKTSACKKCEAPMIWTKTEAGKNMPLDADPADNGTFCLLESPDDGSPLAVHRTKTPADYDGEFYMPHWSTCPEADSFRK